MLPWNAKAAKAGRCTVKKREVTGGASPKTIV
jgi:hypothetical protein